ncbi:MAG: Gfo/Idh/MocA family oxidoreductase [Pseudorhodobacter sp.]|nr:Gfo/Idh/MocA family oxidoreductase [Rhizobacter sp.]
MLKIAVAGAGVAGREHIGLIRQNPRARLCALVDSSPAAHAVAAAHGVPLFESLSDLFAASGLKPQGVILATPHQHQVRDAFACLQHFTPALMEKPMVNKFDDVVALRAALQFRAVPVLVGHRRRHSAVLAEAQRVIASGELGRIVSVNSSALFCKPDSYFSAGLWRKQVGGGPLLINLIHEIDNIRFLCGSSCGDIVAVQAMASNSVRGFEVEDSAAVTLRFENGSLGSLILSDAAAAPRSWEQTSGDDPAFARYADQDSCFVAGTLGSIAIPTLRRWQAKGEGSWNEAMRTDTLTPAKTHDNDDPSARQLEHFCDVIEGRCPPKVTVDDAARSLSVTLAIIKAVQTGGTVKPLDVRDNKVEAKSQTRLGATKRTLKPTQVDASTLAEIEGPEAS